MSIPRNLSKLADGADTNGVLGEANGGTGATSLSSITVGNATTATSATTATNLASGSAGTIPYQSASGTTAMLAAGSSGQLLQSNGTSAPSWVAAPSTSPAGSTGQVQYNNAGAFGASASLTFDGTNLGVLGGSVTTPAAKIHAVGNVRASNGAGTLYTQLANDGVYAFATDLYMFAQAGYANIFYAGGAEKFRFGPSGQFGIGGANYGTSGQVLTSAGSGSAPTWSTISAGNMSIYTANGATVPVGNAFLLNSNTSLPSGWTFDGAGNGYTVPSGQQWVGLFNSRWVSTSFYGGLVSHNDGGTTFRSFVAGGTNTGSTNLDDYKPVILFRIQ